MTDKFLLFLDTETRSPVSIKHGAAKYATQAEVIVVSWAEGVDGEARVWDTSEPEPKGLVAALERVRDEPDAEIWAHQSYFDRTVSRSRIAGVSIPFERWRCSMTLALSHGLPGGLDKLGEIFGFADAVRKDKRGKDLIKLFCVPRKDGNYNDRSTHPAEWQEFLRYARQDIPPMQMLYRKCPKWNYGGSGAVAKREVGFWQLDQRVNDTGFAVDVDFATHAVRATKAEKKRLNDQVAEDSDGEVERLTQGARLIEFIDSAYGIRLKDLKAATLEEVLRDPDLPTEVAELLRMRLQASKASSSKYERLLQTNVAGRIHGALLFNGAQRTGRVAGRIFQPHNLPRPTHKMPEIEAAIEAFKAEAEEFVCVPAPDCKPDKVKNYNIMGYAASCLRSTIVPAPGYKIVQSDLSNIEGRMMAWIAGEAWKLQAFRDFDAGIGPDLYKVSAGEMFGVDPRSIADEDDLRQNGKITELSLQFQGGVNAAVTMAMTQKLDLAKIARNAWDAIPRSALQDAGEVYHWAKQNRRTYGLDREVYVVFEAFKRLWRDKHPSTVGLWRGIREAATAAISYPKERFSVRNLTFVRDGEWLYLRLPSGRLLCYPRPEIDGTGQISFMGVHQKTKKWCRIYTYEGKFSENAIQAAARDVIWYAMPEIQDAGYRIVLNVHDEVVGEAPIGRQDLNDAHMSGILAANRDWMPDLPLAAKGRTGTRYGK